MLWDLIESETYGLVQSLGEARRVLVTTGLIQIPQVTGPSAQLLLQIIEGVSFSVLETIPAPRLQDVVYHLDIFGLFGVYYLVVSNICRCPSPAIGGRSDLT